MRNIKKTYVPPTAEIIVMQTEGFLADSAPASDDVVGDGVWCAPKRNKDDSIWKDFDPDQKYY